MLLHVYQCLYHSTKLQHSFAEQVYKTNLFWNSSNVSESFSKDDKHFTSSTTKSWCATVKGSVSTSKDDDISKQFW